MDKISLLALLALLAGASFAAPLGIGNAEEVFYRDILQISSFPGAPFTGNPFTDIIMVFFIPTGFMILFIHYVAAMFWQGHAKLNLLFTLMVYLFIIGSGAFQYFVGLASGYIPILLFFGGIFFVLQHFRRQTHSVAQGGGAHPMSMGALYTQQASGEGSIYMELLRNARTYQEQQRIVDESISAFQKEYDGARKEHNDRLAQSLQA